MQSWSPNLSSLKPQRLAAAVAAARLWDGSLLGCEIRQSGWERFSHRCAFPAGPARSRVGPGPGSRFHGRFPTPGVCRAVWFGTALSSAPLLSRPKATATFTNQVLPRLSPPWSLRGKAGAAGRPQKGCRRGREDPPLLLPRLKDSPGIRREVHIKSPPYLLLQSVPVSLGSWKGLNQEFSPGETLWGLERQR